MPQANFSVLCDPQALAVNTRGELTPSQDAALRTRLPSVFGPSCVVLIGVCILGFVLYHWRIAVAIVRIKDPLVSTAHVFGLTFSIPSLHVLVGLIVGGWALVWLGNVRTLIGRARAARALRPGNVRWVDGTITWDGDAYVARCPRRRGVLTPWNGDPIEDLVPGPYRLWFLPYGGWLLSVQPFATGTLPMFAGREARQASLIDVLASANHFHLDALDANRAGRVSEEQAQAMARQEKRSQVWALVIGIGLIASSPAFWYFGYFDAAVICGLAGLVIYIGLLRQPARSALDKDLAARQVAIVEGPARKVHQRKFSFAGLIASGGDDGTNDIYYYDIAGTRFTVSETAYHALVDGIPCRAYYLPRSKTLVNLEPI